MEIKDLVSNLWNKILNNGITKNLDFDQRTRIRILNAISIIGSFFALSYCIILAFNSEFRLARNDIIFILNLMLVYFFNYLKLYRFGTVLVFITLPITLLYVNYEYGKIGTEYFYYASIVLCFYYYKKPRNQFLTSIYLVAMVILTKYLEEVIIPNDYAIEYSFYILITNILMSSVILVVSILLFVNQHQKYQLEIAQKNQLLQNALEETKQKNEQVNLILKELNHRVKNNLQMVSSLFNIQSYKTKNRETRQALKDARNRIVSIAIMHQKLYKDNLFYEVRLKKYIEELVDYLIQTNGDDNVNTTVNVDDIKLRIEDTVHVGLIINELITNALKYGLNKQAQNSKIEVFIASVENELNIAISDSGKGFPENFRIEQSDTFGLDLVNNIVTQHNGKIEITNNNGAMVKLKLKITDFSD